MKKAIMLLGGIGIGAGLMYFMDPDRGGSRRALVRDKTAGTVSSTSDAIASKSRDLKNRAKGLIAGAGAVPDETAQNRPADHAVH